MHKIFLPINTKSLYLNIFNDNEKGHTCTVATPIVQGNSINHELQQIYKIPSQIDFQAYPDLIVYLTSNSKSIVKINNVFLFDKLKVNGNPITPGTRFCLFIKQEIDPTRAQYGRTKLHYPIGLFFDELNINNRKVLASVSKALNDYAFIINGFEYDFEENSLNFIATIVGYHNIPYSRVFINSKGVGPKFSKVSVEDENSYDLEIVSLKHLYGDMVNIENYSEAIEKGNEKAREIVENKLVESGASGIDFVSKDYPYSAFDFQYFKDGLMHYCLVKGTYTEMDYLDLTSEQYRFVNLFPTASIVLVKSVFQKNEISCFDAKKLERFTTNVLSMRLTKKGE